jgi:hypothetical protein
LRSSGTALIAARNCLVVIRQGGEVSGFSLRTIAIATLDSTRAAKTGNTNSVRLRNGGHKDASEQPGSCHRSSKIAYWIGHRRQRESREIVSSISDFVMDLWRFEKTEPSKGRDDDEKPPLVTTNRRLQSRARPVLRSDESPRWCSRREVVTRDARVTVLGLT